LARGNYDQAREKLERNHGWFGSQLAYLHPSYTIDWKKGNFDKAVGALIPFHKNILWTRFYNGGNPAVFAMERAFAEYNAGRISEDAGKKEDAEKYYRSFLERFKNSDGGIPEKEDAEKRLAAMK
jgi:tetratricopeptide (TPR) repeat protein